MQNKNNEEIKKAIKKVKESKIIDISEESIEDAVKTDSEDGTPKEDAVHTDEESKILDDESYINRSKDKIKQDYLSIDDDEAKKKDIDEKIDPSKQEEGEEINAYYQKSYPQDEKESQKDEKDEDPMEEESTQLGTPDAQKDQFLVSTGQLPPATSTGYDTPDRKAKKKLLGK